jgi:tagatose 6-phosphate kinase
VIVVGGFNPAVDRLLDLPALAHGAVNRAQRARALPGGKGLHVALTVAALGEPATLVGPCDARHASWFASYLKARGVRFEAVAIHDEIRTCLALREPDGGITEILEPGPMVEPEAAAQLRARFLDASRSASLAVLSGSLPRGLPASTYADRIDELRKAGTPCLLDTSGEALVLGAARLPALVKPNRDELGDLAGAPVCDVPAALASLRSLQARGLACVVVSLGAEGALAAWHGRLARVQTPRVAARNPVGSGDCLLGGLAVACARGLGPEEALRLGIACGAANAAGDDTGVVARSDVERLAPTVSIDWLD